ncbi:IS605 OrfB family transposase [Methanolobus psychrophilus R15]|nr:IS605 OrfB family transposase [Methanolobus psychrophilus R15]
MLLTIKSKLVTTPEQHDQLLRTMESFNKACNYISKFAHNKRVFSKFKLQKHLYYEIREKFSLSSQLAVRAFAKVAESYKVDKKIIHQFKPHGAVVYDPRILSISKDIVSILTLDGRIKTQIKYRKDKNIDNKKGQIDLIYKNRKFYLQIVIDQPEATPINSEEFLGVDLGIVNIAATSDGKIYSGEKCQKVREKYARIKAKLQSVGTYSAKRHLRKISKKERRFKKDTNHCISKDIVQTAKDTNRSIALEELTGIRERTTVRKVDRDKYVKWAFNELRQFIEYKAKINGVIVRFVDPAYTSKQCSGCGHISDKNRKKQDAFSCQKCGHTENADWNASKNIASRAAINQPIVLCSAN